MRVFSLSSNPNSPCMLFQMDGLTIMLDCGVNLNSLSLFLPLPLVNNEAFSGLPSYKIKDIDQSMLNLDDIKDINSIPFIDNDPELSLPEFNLISLKTIDAILVSNYRAILALPYLTEHLGFEGAIFATEPTLEYGKMLMEELCEFINRVPKHKRSEDWRHSHVFRKLFPHMDEHVTPFSWKRCYNLKDISNCISKVKRVSFDEKTNLFGLATISAHSSGLGIGSSNWIIQANSVKLSYLSGSSQFSTHTKPFDLPPLKDCDILICTDITNAHACEPDSMLANFCEALLTTLKLGGNVLIPCNPTGVVYDLLECLASYLDQSGFSHVPIYFISPVAKSSLAHANIYSEWLNSQKQSKVYIPEYPFIHTEMMNANRLFVYPHIHGRFSETYKSPCIVFTGSPSLRVGPAVHFIDIWGSSHTNSIIFIESDVPYVEAIKPYHGKMFMKIYYCPIDTRLTFAQTNKLIKDLNPKHTVVPSQYINSNEVDVHLDYSLDVIPLSREGSVDIQINSDFENIEIEAALAKNVVPQMIDNKVVLPIIGKLDMFDNRIVLKNVSSDSSSITRRPLLYGDVTTNSLVAALEKSGVPVAGVDDSVVTVGTSGKDPDAILSIAAGCINIVGAREPLRVKLANAIVSCLKTV